jgi:hypothetical protein
MSRQILRWAGLIAGISIVLAVAIRPLDEGPREAWWEQDWRSHPELLEAGRARRAAFNEEERLKRAWLQAHARAVATASASRADQPFTLLAAAGVPPVVSARYDSIARSELRATGEPAPRHRVVLAIELDSSLSIGWPYQRIVVLPQRASDPCTVIMRVSRTSVNRTRSSYFGLHPEDRLLGTCAFYAAFGTPGAGTATWLRDTRQATVAYLQPPPAQATDTGRIDATWYRDFPLQLRGCRAERLDACAAVISPTAASAQPFYIEDQTYFEEFARRDWSATDIVERSPRSLSSELAPVSYGLAAALVKDLGPERFGTLWRSDRGIEQEFERQEGRPLAAWAGEYILTRMEPYDAGPGLPAVQVAFAVAILAFGTALTLLRSPRQLS